MMPIPYASEQGIKSAEQGIRSSHQGIYLSDQGTPGISPGFPSYVYGVSEQLRTRNRLRGLTAPTGDRQGSPTCSTLIDGTVGAPDPGDPVRSEGCGPRSKV